MEIMAGKYEAKVVDYGLKQTKSGAQQVVVRFRWNDEFEYNWYGSFNEGKAREITVRTLELLGCSSEELWNLADGPASGMLDTDKTVSIKVEIETGNDGKDYPKIKWVSPLSSGGIKDGMSKEEAKSAFKNMGIVIKTANKDTSEIPF